MLRNTQDPQDIASFARFCSILDYEMDKCEWVNGLKWMDSWKRSQINDAQVFCWILTKLTDLMHLILNGIQCLAPLAAWLICVSVRVCFRCVSVCKCVCVWVCCAWVYISKWTSQINQPYIECNFVLKLISLSNYPKNEHQHTHKDAQAAATVAELRFCPEPEANSHGYNLDMPVRSSKVQSPRSDSLKNRSDTLPLATHLNVLYMYIMYQV